MRAESNGKSKELMALEARMKELQRKRQEQILKDEKKERELERRLRACIGDLVIQYLPEYRRYEKDELSEIIEAAMNSRDCRKMIGKIQGESLKDEEPEADLSRSDEDAVGVVKSDIADADVLPEGEDS